MRDPTRQEVISSILQGIGNAQRDYKKAYESHINSEFAPEYLMTIYIFQSILELKEERCHCAYGISLEEPVYDLARALKVRGRYSNHGRVYGDCDLSLRSINDDKPLAVIEVKKNLRNYWGDIARLSYLVEKGLEFGIFASYWSEEIKDSFSREVKGRIENRIGSILSSVKKDVAELGYDHYIDLVGPIKTLQFAAEKPGQKEKWKWCPVCFIIYNKKKP